jgi:hypothetical protein
MIGVPFLATAMCWLLPSPPGDVRAHSRAAPDRFDQVRGQTLEVAARGMTR